MIGADRSLRLFALSHNVQSSGAYTIGSAGHELLVISRAGLPRPTPRAYQEHATRAAHGSSPPGVLIDQYGVDDPIIDPLRGPQLIAQHCRRLAAYCLPTGAETVSDRKQLGTFVHNNSLRDT